MVIKVKVKVGGKTTDQEIEIELCNEQILALGRKYNELEASKIALSEYKPVGAILTKADNRGNEEWAGE